MNTNKNSFEMKNGQVKRNRKTTTKYEFQQDENRKNIFYLILISQ